MSEFVSQVLKSVSQGNILDEHTSENLMNCLMQGDCSPVQTAGMLAAMTVRGEAVSEIVGFARAMRAHAVPIHIPYPVVDTCGTGGDGGQTFNISTAAAFVAAAGGVRVAKHGNRAVSSKSGSADVLTALGARIDLDTAEAMACLEQSNLCFLFAPNYHPAMKYAAETRKQLGFRTIFNILGPLTNPAFPTQQVLGVYRPELVEKVAQALCRLGSEHVLVVHGDGGIDEFSVTGSTAVAEVKDGQVTTYSVSPNDVGLENHPLDEVAGGDAVKNADLIRQALSGIPGANRDIVAFNAGAVLYVAGKAETLERGVRLAQELMSNGAAQQTLRAFIEATHAASRTEVAQ